MCLQEKFNCLRLKNFSLQEAVVVPAFAFLLTTLIVWVFEYTFPGVLGMLNLFWLFILAIGTVITGECFKVYGNPPLLIIFGTLSFTTGLLLGFSYFETISISYFCTRPNDYKECKLVANMFLLTVALHTLLYPVVVVLYIFVAFSVKRWAFADPVIHAYFYPTDYLGQARDDIAVGVPFPGQGVQLSRLPDTSQSQVLKAVDTAPNRFVNP